MNSVCVWYSSPMYVFTGCDPSLHSWVSVSGHFNGLAAVAFLPSPRAPAKSMWEPRSPPLLSHWNDEATPPISLHEESHPVNTYLLYIFKIASGWQEYTVALISIRKNYYAFVPIINSLRQQGCLSTSFSRLERDIRRRGAFTWYWIQMHFR